MNKNYDMPTRAVSKNLVGMRFGRLRVRLMLGAHNSRIYWLCECACGTEISVATAKLTSRNTVSCGCAKRDRMLSINNGHTTHGKSKTRAYVAWGNMMQRCYNPQNRHYTRYGGRGIQVEDAFHDFTNFHAHMGDCPEGLTLERVDNDKGYVSGNLIWATDASQRRNRSDNVVVNVHGRQMIATDAAALAGMSATKFLARLHKGMPVCDILTVPHNTRRPIELYGEKTSLIAISRATGIPYQRLWARIHRQGLSVEAAIERG